MNNNDANRDSHKIPSTDGERVGMRRIQRVRLPFQREMEHLWKRWRVVSEGGIPSRCHSLTLKATNFQDCQGRLLTPPSN